MNKWVHKWMNQMHVCRSCHVMLSSPVLAFNAGAVSCDAVLCCAAVLCYAVLCDAMLCYANCVMSCHVTSCYFMPLFSRLVCVSVCVGFATVYTTRLCENVNKCIHLEGSEDAGMQTWKCVFKIFKCVCKYLSSMHLRKALAGTLLQCSVVVA